MRMFEWLKKLFRKKKSKQKLYEETGEIIRTEPMEFHVVREVKTEPKPEHIQKGIVSSASVRDVREQLEKIKEEQVKKQFLPELQTHRRTVSHSYIPPAERHREAISKAMKGKASSQYLKTIKKSPKIKIEEED